MPFLSPEDVHVAAASVPRGTAQHTSSQLGADSELGRLFREIGVATRVVNSLKARINALSPVSRLPAEIIAYVFTELAGLQPPSISFIGGYSPRVLRLGWIVVVQVCRRWRLIAMESSSLWSSVTFAIGSRWAEYMLWLSRRIPISIDAYMGRRRCQPEDAEQIARHICHTHTLNLSVDDDSLRGYVSLLVEPAPFLHALCLDDSHRRTDRNPELVLSTPMDFLAGHAPSLRTVELNNVFIPWDSAVSLFKDLHDLSISLPRPQSEYENTGRWAPPLSQLLDILDNMPELQTLGLQACLPRFKRDQDTLFPSDGVRKIALPHLRSLRLAGSGTEVAQMLSRLSLQSDIEIDLAASVCADDNTVDDTCNVFRALSNHLAPGGGHPLRIDNVHIQDENFSLYMTGDMTFENGNTSRLALEFTIIHTEDKFDATVFFFTVLPIQPVSTIQITDLYLEHHDWNLLFETPATLLVHSLSIQLGHSSSEEEFIRFLSDNVRGRTGLRPLKLSQLRSLIITGGDMSESTLESIAKALRAHKERGRMLEKLVFDRCSQTEADYDAATAGLFEGIVGEVVVRLEHRVAYYHRFH